MLLFNVISFLAAGGLAAVPSGTPEQPKTGDEFQDGMLAAHNWYRDQHGAEALTWDEGLATRSKEWSAQCVEAHSGDNDTGENFMRQPQQPKNWGISVNGWGSERTNYDWNNPLGDGSPGTGSGQAGNTRTPGSLGNAQGNNIMPNPVRQGPLPPWSPGFEVITNRISDPESDRTGVDSGNRFGDDSSGTGRWSPGFHPGNNIKKGCPGIQPPSPGTSGSFDKAPIPMMPAPEVPIPGITGNTASGSGDDGLKAPDIIISDRGSLGMGQERPADAQGHAQAHNDVSTNNVKRKRQSFDAGQAPGNGPPMDSTGYGQGNSGWGNPAQAQGGRKVTGHFTQLVWKQTRSLGCGWTKCSKGNHVVCKYSPAGNFDNAQLHQQNVGKQIKGSATDQWQP